jgi:hypothetical protein
MKGFKKSVILVVLLSLIAFSRSKACAQTEYCVDNGGCGYDEICRTSTLAPAIALGTIALVAIIALAIQNTTGHAHCHTHQGNSCH